MEMFSSGAEERISKPNSSKKKFRGQHKFMGAGRSVSKTFFSGVSAGKWLQFWKLRSIMSSREVDRQQGRRLLLLASPECGGLHEVGGGGGAAAASVRGLDH